MRLEYPLPVQFMFGLTDSGNEVVNLNKNGRPLHIYTGSCSYHVHLTPGKFRLRKIHLTGDPVDQQIALSNAALVNYIADPDSHWRALAKAGEIVQFSGRRCFNPPILIARTRRDDIARRLQGIPGLRVPATLRFAPRHPHDFVRVATENGLRFPIIVRLAGDHGGVSTVRVDSATDWSAINQIAWGGREVYLTEFVDFADADGRYRKHRIVMIQGEALLRHVIIGEDWLLHSRARKFEAENDAEETYRLKHFSAETLPRIKPVLDEIYRRIGLDYFGIDCHVSDAGVITLFEANATMNILHNAGSPNRWDETCAAIRSRLEAALEKHILDNSLGSVQP